MKFNHLAHLTVAALVAVGMTACGGSSEGGMQPQQSQAPGGAQTQSSSSSNGGSSSSDNSTPEGAGEMFLKAMGSNDPRGMCQVMAAAGTTIEKSGTMDSCAENMKAAAEVGKLLSTDLQKAKISNVKVNGNDADFQGATVDPKTVDEIITQFKATKIDGKWYVVAG